MHLFNVFLFAANGMDYVLMDTTLIFPSHSKPGYIKNVTVTILSDIIVESTEFFQVHLSSINPHTTIDNNKRDARAGIYDQTGELCGASLPLSSVRNLRILYIIDCYVIINATFTNDSFGTTMSCMHEVSLIREVF